MAASKKLMSVKRDWRERDVRVVLSALIIAVATVATIALFASQLFSCRGSPTGSGKRPPDS